MTIPGSGHRGVCDTLGRVDDLEQLVGSWLPVPDVAERLGVRLSEVRRMLDEGDLVALKVGEPRVARVPEAFLTPDGPLPSLRGTVVVLRDGGMSPSELVRWLFTPDASLPGGGSAIEALRAGATTEVRRRAMESAW